MIQHELDRLLKEAKGNKELKEKLIATKNAEDPVYEFCSLCQSLGYDIKIGELFACGQDMNDSKLRSVSKRNRRLGRYLRAIFHYSRMVQIKKQGLCPAFVIDFNL